MKKDLSNINSLLVVVDYQNDFVDGVLGFKDAENLYPKILKLVNNFNDSKNTNKLCVFTKDTHEEKFYLSTLEGKKLPLHCEKNTKGNELYRDLESICKSCYVFNKDSYMSFDLIDFLRKNRLDQTIQQVFIVGLITDVCVISNAVSLRSLLPKAQVYIVKDCVDTVNKNIENSVFDFIKSIDVELIESDKIKI